MHIRIQWQIPFKPPYIISQPQPCLYQWLWAHIRKQARRPPKYHLKKRNIKNAKAEGWSNEWNILQLKVLDINNNLYINGNKEH